MPHDAGELKPEKLQAELEKCPDYLRRQDFLCEFHYYLGVATQMRGDKAAAAQAFAKSRDSRASRNLEHFLSQVALRQMGLPVR